MEPEGLTDMSKLAFAMRRDGSRGWASTQRDGSIRFFETPAQALADHIRECEVALFDMLGWDDVEVADA